MHSSHGKIRTLFLGDILSLAIAQVDAPKLLLLWQQTFTNKTKINAPIGAMTDRTRKLELRFYHLEDSLKYSFSKKKFCWENRRL